MLTTLEGTEACRSVDFENAVLRLIHGTLNLLEQLATIEKHSACELDTMASLCDFLSKLQVDTRRPAVSFGSGVETSGMW